VYTWNQGSRYEGNFSKNTKSGYGIRYYSDGKRYEGYWKMNKRHGRGCMIDPMVSETLRVEGDWNMDVKL